MGLDDWLEADWNWQYRLQNNSPDPLPCDYDSEKGKLIFTPQQGQLLQGEKIQTIEVGARRGLFAKDTKMVIEYLLQGTPLYITPETSLYTLKVANLSQKSSHNSGKATQFK